MPLTSPLARADPSGRVRRATLTCGGPARRPPPIPLTWRIRERLELAVIGLGYVGLPLAISFVEAGLARRRGRRQRRAASRELSRGRSPIDDISDARLARRARRRVCASSAAGGGRPGRRRRRSSSASRRRSRRRRIPTSAPVLSAAELIREHLRTGQLVILQSTTFPGTTTGPFREVARAERPHRRHRLRPRLRPGAGQPGRSRPAPAKDVPAWSARRPRRRRRAPPRCCAASTTTSSSSPRPTRPSWPSSSRTSSATSTSPSSTSWPCSASGWASTSGRSSRPRRRSRSGS